MSMKDEVEQIILRSILKDGLDAVPQDYEFIICLLYTSDAADEL